MSNIPVLEDLNVEHGIKEFEKALNSMSNNKALDITIEESLKSSSSLTSIRLQCSPNGQG